MKRMTHFGTIAARFAAMSAVLWGCFGSHDNDFDPLPADASMARRVQVDGGRTPEVDSGQADDQSAWDTCEEFVAAGSPPNARCVDATFGRCEMDVIDPCCGSALICRGGEILEDLLCAAGCGADIIATTCEDYAPPPPEADPCRDDSTCTDGRYCGAGDGADGTGPGCGICMVPIDQCGPSADTECGPGMVCQQRPPSPCSCGGSEYLCVRHCRAGSAERCALDETCEDDGHCLPKSCEEDDYACSPNHRCVPFSSTADSHGCARITCSADANCDCGVCMRGLCRSGPGFCQHPRPVPASQ